MIKINKLNISIDEKQILKNISLGFELGKNYCILGKNGSGKSTLAGVLMGNPKYTIKSGEVEIDGKNLIEMKPDDRSKMGLFLSFQNIPELKGIKLGEYLRTIYNIHLQNRQPDVKPLTPFVFKRFIKKYLDEFGIEENFLFRDLNVGFSGGERRKLEMLQIRLIEPKYIILDEIDSGLDIHAIKLVFEMIKTISKKDNCLILITHNFKLIDYIDVERVFVMEKGEIIKKGDKRIVEEF